MPLPKISTPTYELVLPSTKETVTYRPFLVKEEKLLVLALETEDTKQITTAIKTVIKNCIESPKNIKVETLPTFDIEYLFLNIRGKSVGEELEVNIIAPDDQVTEIPVRIAIDDIKVNTTKDHTRQIKVDDNITMEMKYPSLDEFIKSNFDVNQRTNVDQSFDLIAACIDKIYTAEEVWDSSDVTKKELIEFLEEMNSVQFKQIETFFETMPKLSHKLKVKNPKTKVESEIVLEGLSSFFA
jgi:nucleoid DNA-binding protein